MTLVNCDYCKHNFKINPKTKPLRGGGQENYFECPHCKHRYITAIFTKKGLALQKTVQQVWALFLVAPSRNSKAVLGLRLRRLQIALAAEVSAPSVR